MLSLEEKIRFFNGQGSWETYTADGKIPHFFMSDGPHGLRKQVAENYRDLNKSNRATCFPTASCVASSWDKDIAELLGSALADEARAEKVNLVLGPGMNIKRSPLCGRNFEYFSEDSYLTGVMAASYVDGMQKKGVGACIKHFACNNQEKRRQTSSSNVDETTLRKIYLKAFEYVVKKSKPAAVMCSYNKLNGTYTCHNRHLLTEILRDEWNYEGAVISDWGACIDAPACIKAGLDLAMPDSFGYFSKQIKTALENGSLEEKDLDRANGRVLKLIKDFSLEKTGEGDAAEGDRVDFEKQHQIALKIAEASAVLLKNDGILPLEPDAAVVSGEAASVARKSVAVPESVSVVPALSEPAGNASAAAAPSSAAGVKRIFVLGELAEFMKFQGGGSSHISTADFPDAVESLKKQGFDVIYEKGYYSGFCKKSRVKSKNAPLIKSALLQLKKAMAENPEMPVLFFTGLTDAYEGEGFDRKNLFLPQEQLELLSKVLELTKNVVIVNFSGAPVDLTFAKDCRGILQMYLCGEACGEAVADLICGKVNPSGCLAETWPLKIEDTPCYKNFAPEGDEVNYEEGCLVGYRWYKSKNIPVQFEFGYGLSYTTFEEEIIRDDGNEITVRVKNTGKRAGGHVVQLYRQGELAGFTKVYLEAGEEKTVVVLMDETVKKTEALKSTETIELPESSETGLTDSKIKQTNQSQPIQMAKHTFTVTDSLGDMARKSLRIRVFLKIVRLALAVMTKKSMEDPAVKIEIAAIEENPLESLISTSGGIITEKFTGVLVRWANGKLC